MSETNILRLAERISDEGAAYEYLEELRWHGSPIYPHCGNEDRCYFLNPANGKGRKTRTGKPTQRRLWKCGACRRQFSVLTDTVMHGTKIPVRTWVFVIFGSVSVCRPHHRLLHDGGFGLRMVEGRPVFTRPDGSVIEDGQAPP